MLKKMHLKWLTFKAYYIDRLLCPARYKNLRTIDKALATSKRKGRKAAAKMWATKKAYHILNIKE